RSFARSPGLFPSVIPCPMSSFYAELTVDGQPPYPLRQCQFEFTQATDQRGRAAAKVRHGLLQLTLDVPTDDQLLDWANTVHKPLSGHVTFFEDDRRTARETVSFAAGQCVSYQESFVAGDGEAGAYVCQLLITSAGLTLAPGGAPQAFVAPAARAYATPVTAIAASATSATALVRRLPLITGHPPFTVKGASKGKPALDRIEFSRQLTNQQEGMNRLTVAQFLANRDQYNKLRKTKGTGRDPKGDAAQKIAREKALVLKVEELQLADDDLTESEAMTVATQWLATQAALHDPDQVAGGNSQTVTGLGDARVNSSLGAQWPKRIKGIDAQVRKQAATMSQREQEDTLLTIALPLT
ncbi:MAG: type VI secretion system tube protein TssD, partial [Janthinobacterium lividum]